jgi:predicted RNA-binding Zn-ribbon protein involved in translation (DUF1610 family)
MSWLRRLTEGYKQVSAALAQETHRTTVRADCPHCGEETTWSVRVLNNYFRCQQCGRDPYAGPVEAADDHSAEALEDRDRPADA